MDMGGEVPLLGEQSTSHLLSFASKQQHSVLIPSRQKYPQRENRDEITESPLIAVETFQGFEENLPLTPVAH